jgi:hypothetical protein
VTELKVVVERRDDTRRLCGLEQRDRVLIVMFRMSSQHFVNNFDVEYRAESCRDLQHPNRFGTEASDAVPNHLLQSARYLLWIGLRDIIAADGWERSVLGQVPE